MIDRINNKNIMYVLVKYFIYNNTIMELDQEKGRKWSQILPAFVGKKK